MIAAPLAVELAKKCGRGWAAGAPGRAFGAFLGVRAPVLRALAVSGATQSSRQAAQGAPGELPAGRRCRRRRRVVGRLQASRTCWLLGVCSRDVKRLKINRDELGREGWASRGTRLGQPLRILRGGQLWPAGPWAALGLDSGVRVQVEGAQSRIQAQMNAAEGLGGARRGLGGSGGAATTAGSGGGEGWPAREFFAAFTQYFALSTM